MRWAQIVIFYYITGRMFFLIRAEFDYPQWVDLYYAWDAGKDLLFVTAIHSLMPVIFRWISKPVIIFCLIRFIWEIINPFTMVEINHPTAVITFFGVLLIGVITLLIVDLVKRWKQN